MPILTLVSLCLAILLMPAGHALAQAIVGVEFEYTVRKGDYLTRIGARHGADPVVLARENGLDYFGHIHPDQRIRVVNRHIAPPPRQEGIVINLPQRMLYLYRAGRLQAHYPVGLGRPDWPTPMGLFTVRSKEVDKEWIVPESIQEEMRERGVEVLTRVPPGPDNPLGRHWMGLSPGAWGMHGTNAPASVYHFQSHGCIRLHPDDAEALYGLLEAGDPVEIVYRPLLLAQGSDGTIFLEVHRDIYMRTGNPWLLLKREVERQDIGRDLDWMRVARMMACRDGVARAVGTVSGLAPAGHGGEKTR